MTLEPGHDGKGFVAQEWPFFWLTRATGIYLRKLEAALKKIGLDIPRWRVLMCVRPEEAKNVSEIADLAITKLPTMMKIIQRMQADGLVICEPRPNDGRFTDVTLTENGMAAREQAWHTAEKIYAKVFADTPPGDLDQLNALLRLVVERLEEE